LRAPAGGHRLRREVLGGLWSVPLNVAAQRAEVGPKVSQHLAQTRLGRFGAVERAEAAVDVVKAVVEGVKIQRGEAKRIGVIPDPPQSWQFAGRLGHD
jgi:hypothetical protein